ncbi:carbohydrate sulfotransferase 11 [Diachasma alloeum]|uniref:carbohydrate sulfotransferase 11 n=1 Tax=Diachasma alloeum TaxID=454923 RepID=UPI0007383C3C|nr:carbohydrate sulfotransferase 11 [Diachasma alloeum]
MTLEANLLTKSNPRGFHRLLTVRRVTFVMGIFLLMILAIYHYVSVTDRHLNELSEYQVVLRSHLGETDDEVRTPSVKPTTIKVIPRINYELRGKEEMEAEFLRRGDHVKQKCRELGLMGRGKNVPQLNAQEFFINYDYHVIYCSVFKAASTSWLYNMNLLAGVPAEDLRKSLESISPVKMARKKYARPSQSELLKALDKNLSFLIVRHPFARLVRTYYDKFVLEGDDKFYQEVGLKIIDRTRLEDDLTARLKVMDHEGLPPTLKQTDLPPTFEELVKFALCEWRDNKPQDEHWKPITRFCTSCQVPFDYIIKFETLEEEEQVLIERANLQDVLKPKWEDNSSSEEIEDLEREYFSQLSKRQILELYEYYKADFELFEYSMDKYLAYGQDVPFVSLPCRQIPPSRPRK